MGRPALSKARVDEVARTYDMVRRQHPDRSVTARMVWERLRNKNPPRFRKVQALVAQFPVKYQRSTQSITGKLPLSSQIALWQALCFHDGYFSSY